MNNIQMEKSLCEEISYWDFFDLPRSHIVLNDGSLVSGIKVSLIDIESLDELEINQITNGLRSMLNSIAEGVSVQFVLSVSSNYLNLIDQHAKSFSKKIHPLIKTIAKFREDKLESAVDSNELYLPELMIFLKTPSIKTKKASLFKSNKQTLFSNQSEESYLETLELLFQNIDTLKSSLNAIGINSKDLNRSELIEKIYSFLNPKRSKEIGVPQIREQKDLENLEGLINLEETSPREQLTFGDLVINSNQFILDSHFHKVITLKTLPEVTFAGQLFNFLRMPFHYDLFLTFEVPIQSTEMSKLQQKRKMAHSMSMTTNNKVSDLESESKLSSTEELIKELLNSGQKIFNAELSIVLKEKATNDGQKTLNRQVREVLSRFRSLQGAEGLEESIAAWRIVKNNLPAAPMNLDRAKKMKTNNLADFLPIYGPNGGDSDPVVIFRNRLNGLVSFNPFDSSLPNYNSLVTGSSGAGKSFLNNCILSQELARDLKVFIIDIGGSYKKLTESLGGQYLEIDLSDKYHLNPFYVENPFEEISNQKIKSLLAIIESMVSETNTSHLSKLDRALLEKAIIETYQLKQKDKINPIPTISDLKKLLESYPEESMRSIAKMLYLWTENRPYGKLLDGIGNLKTDAPVCTFDLKGLSAYPDLQSVIILILTDFILTQVEKDKTIKKRIILDEAWELLKSNSAASFMEYCARTLRKTGSGITFITQGVEEIVSSAIGPAILNNTATKFIMLQRGDSKILKETLKLNSQELNLIHSLEQKKGEYSEGFMIEGDRRQVVRIYPSPFEYWLSTSDASDNNFLNELTSKGYTLIEAIEIAAKEYPNGINQKKDKEK